jgi:hypothetical protein
MLQIMSIVTSKERISIYIYIIIIIIIILHKNCRLAVAACRHDL